MHWNVKIFTKEYSTYFAYIKMLDLEKKKDSQFLRLKLYECIAPIADVWPTHLSDVCQQIRRKK